MISHKILKEGVVLIPMHIITEIIPFLLHIGTGSKKYNKTAEDTTRLDLIENIESVGVMTVTSLERTDVPDPVLCRSPEFQCSQLS